MNSKYNPNLKHRELTDVIIKTFYEVFNELGHGFLEKIYEKAITIALKSKGLKVENQVPINVWFRGEKLGEFVADILVEDVILLELKAVNSLLKTHEAQLLNYLKATEIEVGFLLNFGEKPEFKRMAFDNKRKNPNSDNKISLDVLLEQ